MESRQYICIAALLLLVGTAAAADQVKYHVSGTFLYYDHAGQVRPAAGVTARVMDRDTDPQDGDDLLAVATTDSAGRFVAEFTAEEYQDIYILFVAENAAWRVVDSNERTYMWYTPIEWDVPAEKATVDFGGQVIGRNAGSLGRGHNVGAMWIYQAVRRSAEFCRKQGISLTGDAGTYTVVWSDADDATYSSGMRTHIARNHAHQYDVVTHETGHILMQAHSAIPAGSGGRHRIDMAYTRQLAWAEGWATFYAACVLFGRGDAEARMPFFAGGVSVEHVPVNFAEGDMNEMRVAAALWDLYDTHADGGDAVALGFGEIFKALPRGKAIEGFDDFIALLLSGGRYKNDVVDRISAALAHNTIEYSPAKMLAARQR